MGGREGKDCYYCSGYLSMMVSIICGAVSCTNDGGEKDENGMGSKG